MQHMTRIIMAAALTLGLTGAALADDRGNDSRGDDRSRDERVEGEGWGDRQGHRGENGWTDRDRGRGPYDRGYGRVGRRDDRRYDRVGRHNRVDIHRGYVRRGYRSFGPWERARIREARLHLRRVARLAIRDGVITRWERVRIHQARQRLVWVVRGAYHNGGSL